MLRSALARPGAALAIVLVAAACGGTASPTNRPSTGASAQATSTGVASVATASAGGTPTTVAATPTRAATAAPATVAATAIATQATHTTSTTGRIAFGVREGGTSNLYSINADGTDMQKLTTSAGNHLCASFSADASHVAYCGDGSGNFEIWTIKADGTGATQLTHLDGRVLFPDESHDGKKVAFSGTVGDDPNTEIYVVDAATGEGLVALTSCAGLAEGCSNDYPSWSPDGKQIVFIHQDDYVNEVGVNQQVWVMNSDGSKKRQLTTSEPPKDQLPNWSPDGKSIVYASFSNADATNEGIWVMNADGTNQKQLSGCLPTEASPCAAGADFGPVWSPDGTSIAFLRSFMDIGTDDRPIYVMNADGSDQHRLIDQTILAAVPSWQ
jgi:TolB protein